MNYFEDQFIICIFDKKLFTMVTIVALFVLISGIIASVAYALSKEKSVNSISYFILGFSILFISKDFFEHPDEQLTFFFPYFMISILGVHFFVGEATKSKVSIWWNLIPIVISIGVFLIFDFTEFSYMKSPVEKNIELLLVAVLSVVTPFLTHLAKLGIGNLIIRFGSIKWAENEENYLESLVSYAFIGGVAALGSFLLGPLGILIAATFHLSASFVARNKLGLKNNIILSASSALFLLAFSIIYVRQGGFEQLNFLRGEVVEGAFIAGFMVVSHHLFLRLSRFNTGKWQFILGSIAVVIPIVAITAIGLAYTQFERLGGVLALAGMIVSLAVLSVTFALFKNASFVSLKLISIGLALLLLPVIRPVEQVSNIDLESLGIQVNVEGEKSEGLPLSSVTGKWSIQEESSKVYFELGPDDGRTKGEFKRVFGSLKVANTIEESFVDVVLPLEELTTYIGPRDKELMGSGYFKAEEFPEIRFESSVFKTKDDFYIVSGDFTMMGVTKKLDVKLKLEGVGEKESKKVLVFSGGAQVDRTEFGMSPSAKIGNVVDFELEIQMIEED